MNIKKSEYNKYKLLKPLLEINQIPAELNIKGNIVIDKDTKVLCIIGSRKVTNYGKDVVDYLVSGLQGQNIIIVSGLAVGVDTCAHKAALKYNIRTITFPGSGLSEKVLYPSSNIKLLKDIIENNGAAISEYEDDSKSQIYYFPARNRLMAAISDLVLVIEAEEKSGTQITARLALEYNKEVAIVPGSIFSAYSRGTLNLMKDGAHPVVNSDDILHLLKINTDNTKLSQESLFDNLSENENKILSLLSSPQNKDYILENCDLNFSEALVTLTNLESKNIIKDNYGEIVRVR